MKRVSLPALASAAARPPAYPSRRERRRTEVRQRLFRTALRLFAERGFMATTVENITEAADVGKGTFFNYFPSKEHLLLEFGKTRQSKMRRALDQASRGDRRIRQILRELFYALAEEPGQSPEMARSMVVTMLSGDPVRGLVMDKMKEGRGLTAKLFALGQQSGEIRSDRRASELSRVFQEAFLGSLLVWTLHPPAKLAPWLDTSFEILWSGIEARPKQRAKKES
jgi:AcrR family transcriptional regulator